MANESGSSERRPEIQAAERSSSILGDLSLPPTAGPLVLHEYEARLKVDAAQLTDKERADLKYTEDLVRRAKALAPQIKLDGTGGVTFGETARQSLDQLSQKTLEPYRTRDIGVAGELLTELKSTLDECSAHQFPRSKEVAIRRFLSRLPVLGPMVSRVRMVFEEYQKVNPKIVGIEKRIQNQKGRQLGNAVFAENLGNSLGQAYREWDMWILAGEIFVMGQREEFFKRAQRVSTDIVAAADLKREFERLMSFEKRLDRMRQARLDAGADLLISLQAESGARDLANTLQHTVEFTIPEWRRSITLGIIFHDIALGQKMAAAMANTTRTLKEGTMSAMEGVTAEKQRQANELHGNIDDAIGLYDRLVQSLEEDIRSQKELQRKMQEAEPKRRELIRRMKAALDSAGTEEHVASGSYADIIKDAALPPPATPGA